jgi:1-acyl-sn-glycerol-3-phosphate acyltransferase
MSFFSRLLLSAYENVVFYAGLLWIGLLFLLWSLIALVLNPLLPVRLGRRLGRAAIMTVFRLVLGSLVLSGRFRFDLEALDVLRGEKSLVIASNHPSLWDAMLIVSRLPDVACIMKADLIHNIFLGGGARLARYICNESLRKMVMLAVEDVRRGGQLLLFPEGTRTVRHPIGPLTGSIGVIANRANVPVQAIIIETESAFLRKGWPVYKKPRLPITYRVRLGRRFDAPANSAAFMAELEQYFAGELANRMPPSGTSAPVREIATVE